MHSGTQRSFLPETRYQAANHAMREALGEAGSAEGLDSSEPGCAVRGSAARQVLAGGMPAPLEAAEPS